MVRAGHFHDLEHAPNLPHRFVFLVQLFDRPRGTRHLPERVLAPHNDDLAPRQRAARLRVQQHAARVLECEAERHAVQQRLGALDGPGPRDSRERVGHNRVERRGARAWWRGVRKRRGVEQRGVVRPTRKLRMRVICRHPRVEARHALLHRIRRVHERVVLAEGREPERDVRRVCKDG